MQDMSRLDGRRQRTAELCRLPSSLLEANDEAVDR